MYTANRYMPQFVPRVPKTQNSPLYLVDIGAKLTQHIVFLEAPPGFEPGNQGFADPRLTTWLWRQKKQCGSLIGAGNETRTRDIHLGKVTLYH